MNCHIILWFFRNNIGMEHTNYKRVEMKALVDSALECSNHNYGESINQQSKKHEAHTLKGVGSSLTDEGEWIQSAVLRSNILKVKDIASDMKKYALNAAAEAIQVAAACEKIARGFEK